MGGSLTPCRQLRPSPQREHVNASSNHKLFIKACTAQLLSRKNILYRPGADPGFIRGGGVRTSEGGGVSYRNFRSGSKLLQGPGQINKQKKIADSRRGGGGGPITQKNPVSAHVGLLSILIFPTPYRPT